MFKPHDKIKVVPLDSFSRETNIIPNLYEKLSKCRF